MCAGDHGSQRHKPQLEAAIVGAGKHNQLLEEQQILLTPEPTPQAHGDSNRPFSAVFLNALRTPRKHSSHCGPCHFLPVKPPRWTVLTTGDGVSQLVTAFIDYLFPHPNNHCEL